MRTGLVSVHIITICYEALEIKKKHALYLDIYNVVASTRSKIKSIEDFYVYSDALTLKVETSIDVAKKLFDDILGIIYKHNIKVMI